MIAGDLRLTIVVLIDRYLATSKDPDLVASARAFEALPFYLGWDGTTLFLRPDGEILSIDMEGAEREVRVETDPMWKKVAISIAAKRHPELRHLLPTRSVSGVDCDICDATGEFNYQNFKASGMTCPKCCGFGWLEPSG